MTATVRLVLPEPPSSNRYWRVWRGRAVKSQEARDYGEAVRVLCAAQLTDVERAALPLTGPVAVVLAWHRAARRGDLDNRAKVALDSVRGLLYADDKQVVRLEMDRHESPNAGRLDIEVRAVAEPLPPARRRDRRAGLPPTSLKD